jgi:UDP-N-acetylmuramate--alanine ligase
MHIYFVGIGGTGIGPLALIASQAGYEVSGSDAKQSEYTAYLTNKGIELSIEQGSEQMAELHARKPIDWVVSVSAIMRLTPDEPHLQFANENNIRLTERDACLNEILANKKLKMIATAGTHGKTTTTAMFVWAMKHLAIPISYSVGAKTSFADMGHYEPGSEYFVYECDEFHRNFLQFHPYLSVISGVSWDHHEVFPTNDEYNDAFREYIYQTNKTIIWDEDADRLGLETSDSVAICASSNPEIETIALAGLYNRRDAWLVVEALHSLLGTDKAELIRILSKFPGTQRRMEELTPGLFTDYAHTPEKIEGCMSVACEVAKHRNKQVVVVYEPLTNRRQHFMKEQYLNSFKGAKKVYWIPSYLAREDPVQHILTPHELIRYLDTNVDAVPAEMNEELWINIGAELNDSIVVCMSGGGGNSLDEWLRAKVQEQNQ